MSVLYRLVPLVVTGIVVTYSVDFLIFLGLAVAGILAVVYGVVGLVWMYRDHVANRAVAEPGRAR